MALTRAACRSSLRADGCRRGPHGPGARSRALAGVLGGCLLVAAAGAAPAADGEYRSYRVRSGDNLWTLTQTHLQNLRFVGRLQALNGIADPYRLPPGTQLRLPLQWLRRTPGTVRITAVSGDSALVRAGETASEVAIAGVQLRVGDTLRCAADSYATLEFADGSQVRVQAHSEIALDASWVYGAGLFFDSQVALKHGRTESAVPVDAPDRTRLRIRTPAATTSVRGTRFRASADADASSRSEVLRGLVEVAARARTVAVGAGFGTRTRAGAPPASPVALLPAPTLGAGAALVERVPVQFELTSLAGARGYRGQIATDRGFQHLIADFDSAGPSLRGPDIADGDYWLRVRARDVDGIEGQDAVFGVRVNARPEPPFALAPPADGSAGLTPSFRWSAHPQADHYELEVATDTGFAAPLIQESGLRDTDFRAQSALAPGRYYWRIRTVSALEGAGPMSDPLPFRVPHPGPAASAPDVSGSALRVQWSAPAPGLGFQFQLARDEAFSDLRADVRVDEPGVELPRPAGGRYFMRIRTIEADGFTGPFSTPQQIDVPPSRWWLLLLAPVGALLL